jgi:hypothetical protein
MRANHSAAALALLSLLLLSGCETKLQKTVCPGANVLANTSEVTVFKKGMDGDPSGQLYTVDITGVTASCDVDLDQGTTDSSVEISFRANRAPSGDGGTYTVPYYMASMLDGDTVLDKQILAAAFTFEPGQSVTTFTANVPSTVIHLQNGKKPYQYSLLVGIQMTREQFDYAKSHGRYAP